ncbi:tetratricopeptide repeat protein [Piscirickettsia litoralis]|uniref:Uncharacterized protein n=1 Tax=Piscirickettsia litoralis TaxID=1891921 RepID=A0ABX3A573_9GAMM|nr:hypothetical protein [Piscirickettsia litoralis]ODN43764.1 hypothetical protein BGC07_13735 [Piscirickettsia litoralis]
MTTADKSQEISTYYNKLEKLLNINKTSLKEITQTLDQLYQEIQDNDRQKENHKKIEVLIKQALHKKDTKKYHEALLHYYTVFNQIDKGIEFYKSLKTSFDKHIILAKLIKKQDKDSQSYIYHLEKAFFLNIYDDALLKLIADTYSKSKQHFELLSFYNKLLERIPHSAKVYSLRSGVLMDLNQYNPARESAIQAIRLGAAHDLETASHTLTNALLAGVDNTHISKLLRQAKKHIWAHKIVTQTRIINTPSTFFCLEENIKASLMTLNKNFPFKNVIINNIYPQILDPSIDIEKKYLKLCNQ